MKPVRPQRRAILALTGIGALTLSTGTLYAVQSAGAVSAPAGATANAPLHSVTDLTPAAPAEQADTYVGKVEVVRTIGTTPRDKPTDTTQGAGERRDKAGAATLAGRVFLDAAKDSRFDSGDKGIAGVRVSNGRDVVVTDKDGRYELPAYDNMTVTVTQPAGYQVPVDEHHIAQFHYNHLPAGTPQKLRFGGIAPTGPLPSAVNFPMVRSKSSAADAQSCVIAGDLQTYSRREIGYARNGALKDVADRGPLSACGTLFIGDVAGDDLGLYPEMKPAIGLINGPVRFLPGNHDLDLDATDAAHSHDTFRAQMGPEYYSYDVGKTHVIALNDVKFPCTAEVDNADGKHPTCGDPKKPVYNGRLDDNQLAWLANDLAQTPKDKLVVIASHIPFLTYADMGSTIHQLDQVKDVYKLLEGRPAVHVSGHTHSIENLKKGDSYRPWKDVMGVDALPFPHIIAGAMSGDWYSGDLDADGLPMAYQRDGGKPGVVTLDIAGNRFTERFSARGAGEKEQMNVGINSPTFRTWFTTLDEWRKKNPNNAEGKTPPLNDNDLGDPKLVTKDDLARGSWITSNFWMGSSDATVEVSIDGVGGGRAMRTQKQGDEQRSGAEYADPVAAARQLSVGRTSQASTSGDASTQGYRLYRGSQYGPGPARPGNNVADRMHHLWRYDLPKDLPLGVHRAVVKATDSYGRSFTESVTFTVAEKREQMEARTDLFKG